GQPHDPRKAQNDAQEDAEQTPRLTSAGCRRAIPVGWRVVAVSTLTGSLCTGGHCMSPENGS
ncbi:MAG TPA: hypothetical protein VLT88_02615, partial [Desulfosarcina sp.]|nr:hypothetical protein [Desulfosarcina sp.]